MRASVAPHGDFERAVVKWFNRMRGFGFLSQGEGGRIYSCTWRRCGSTACRNCVQAKACWCAMVTAPKVWMATEVKADDDDIADSDLRRLAPPIRQRMRDSRAPV